MKPVIIIGLSVGCSIAAVMIVLAATGAFTMWQAEMAIEKADKYTKTLEVYVEIGYLCDDEGKYIEKARCKSSNYHDTKNYMVSQGEGEQFDLLVQMYPESFCYHHPQNNQWYCGETWT